ncbi:sulfite exporter TauE/SafE family protein [Nonomuraea sp. NPDC050404]|uniref:sulfite exporter TauE/SafE family protein n=1 Tax=Nonomuraea sp. NPDC050404 TaxID=3155783 RepID=UPI00340E2251
MTAAPVVSAELTAMTAAPVVSAELTAMTAALVVPAELTAALVVPMALAVLVGAGTQRVTGLGFALVAGPLLTMVLDPVNGVRLVNLLSLTACLIALPAVWRQADFGRALRLAVPALAVLPAGAWLAAALPSGPLLIAEGVLVIAALLVLRRSTGAPWMSGRAGAAGAGAVSGLMNVTAGLGGPAMTLYATATGWESRSFAATMQVYSILINAGSVAVKGLPQLPLPTVALVVLCTLCGVLAGHLVSPHIDHRRVRQAVLALAAAGGLTAIAKGVITI